MPRTFRLTLALLLIAGGLTACGKRGQLEPPSAQKQAQEEGAPGDSKAGETRAGGRKRIPITPPKRDLFIDGILE